MAPDSPRPKPGLLSRNWSKNSQSSSLVSPTTSAPGTSIEAAPSSCSTKSETNIRPAKRRRKRSSELERSKSRTTLESSDTLVVLSLCKLRIPSPFLQLSPGFADIQLRQLCELPEG